MTSSSNDMASIVAEAARKTGRGVITADSTRQIFDMLSLGLEDVDITIVDICSSVHSLAILETLSYWQAAPPVRWLKLMKQKRHQSFADTAQRLV